MAKEELLEFDGTVTEVTSLTSGSAPEGICTGPDGLIWFTEPGTNKIGKLAWIEKAYVRTDVPGGGGYQPGTGSASVGFGTGSVPPSSRRSSLWWSRDYA